MQIFNYLVFKRIFYMNGNSMNKSKLKIFLTEKEIQNKVKDIALKINEDYKGKELVIVGVLKGSFIFLADLIRYLNVLVKVEFIGISSYEGDKSTGRVRITSDLTTDIKDQHVLLVEDIVDTGITLEYILDLLKVREPTSIKVCALLDKPNAHITTPCIDYVGFSIPNKFVVGYGLDYNNKYRELPYIAIIE